MVRLGDLKAGGRSGVAFRAKEAELPGALPALEARGMKAFGRRAGTSIKGFADEAGREHSRVSTLRATGCLRVMGALVSGGRGGRRGSRTGS